MPADDLDNVAVQLQGLRKTIREVDHAQRRRSILGASGHRSARTFNQLADYIYGRYPWLTQPHGIRTWLSRERSARQTLRPGRIQQLKLRHGTPASCSGVFSRGRNGGHGKR